MYYVLFSLLLSFGSAQLSLLNGDVRLIGLEYYLDTCPIIGLEDLCPGARTGDEHWTNSAYLTQYPPGGDGVSSLNSIFFYSPLCMTDSISSQRNLPAPCSLTRFDFYEVNGTVLYNLSNCIPQIATCDSSDCITCKLNQTNLTVFPVMPLYGNNPECTLKRENSNIYPISNYVLLMVPSPPKDNSYIVEYTSSQTSCTLGYEPPVVVSEVIPVPSYGFQCSVLEILSFVNTTVYREQFYFDANFTAFYVLNTLEFGEKVYTTDTNSCNTFGNCCIQQIFYYYGSDFTPKPPYLPPNSSQSYLLPWLLIAFCLVVHF